MSSRNVVCPKCRTTLKVPATMGAGKIKCPKCATVLAISGQQNTPGGPPQRQSPAAPSFTPPPSSPGQRRGAASSSPDADAFTNIPAFQSNPGAPSRPASPIHPVAQPARPAPANASSRPGAGKPGKSTGKTVSKVLAIVSAVGFSVILLCCGGFGFLAYLGSRSSGWQDVTFRGYTIQMPQGESAKQNTSSFPGVTVHETAYRRRETGSQYFLMVSDSLAAQLRDLEAKDVIGRMSVKLANQTTVQRMGCQGVRGTVTAGRGAGTEAEYFIHNGKLVVAVYAPYSVIKDDVGGSRPPRSNERELDDPDKFFNSLRASSG